MKFNIDNKIVPPPNGIHWIVTDGQYHYKVSIGMTFIIDGKRYLVNDYINGTIYLTYVPIIKDE